MTAIENVAGRITVNRRAARADVPSRPGKKRGKAEAGYRGGRQHERPFIGCERPGAVNVFHRSIGAHDASLDAARLPPNGAHAATERALSQDPLEDGCRAEES